MRRNLVRARAKPLVIASGNSGKLREFRQLLAGLAFDVIGQAQLGLATPAETGGSFFENALLKARFAANAHGGAAIADDSGLQVDALDGAPGIHSARYAGVGADDVANNAKLLAALERLPHDARRANYRCCLVFVNGPGDAAPLTAEGVWHGYMLDSARGTSGFGYDPYFWDPELTLTAAQLSTAEKNRRSHRGIAMRLLLAQLMGRARLPASDVLEAGEHPVPHT